MESEFYFRGMFMSLFIDIEFLLGDSLATLLVGENELKFNILEYVNPKLMLDGKITLVFNFLKRKNNTVFIKYKELLNDLSSFSTEFTLFQNWNKMIRRLYHINLRCEFILNFYGGFSFN